MKRPRRTTALVAAYCSALLAGGCAIGYEAVYDFHTEAFRRGPEALVALDSSGLTVDDGRVTITWRIKDFGLRVAVRNRGASQVVARWVDSRFIDEHGAAHRLVVHEPWSDRHLQERAVIDPGNTVEVSLFPVDWLESFGGSAERSSTRGRGLFEVPGLQLGDSEQEIARRASVNVGKSIATELAVSVDDEVYEYVLQLTVERVEGRAVKDVI